MDTVYFNFAKSQCVDFHVLQTFSFHVIMHMNGGIGMICYRKATLEDLERVWAYNMAMNPDEPRMQRWQPCMQPYQDLHYAEA